MVECCPKCGGTSGYSYRMTTVYQMFVDGWGADALTDNDGGEDCTVGLATCMDCGARMRLSTIDH